MLFRVDPPLKVSSLNKSPYVRGDIILAIPMDADGWTKESLDIGRIRPVQITRCFPAIPNPEERDIFEYGENAWSDNALLCPTYKYALDPIAENRRRLEASTFYKICKKASQSTQCFCDKAKSLFKRK